MADIATAEFLANLKAQYPTGTTSLTGSAEILKNPWWIVAAVAFSTGNRPDAVPVLFKFVLAELEKAQEQSGIAGDKVHEEKLLLARKFRDSLFKSGMVAGYSKAINALNSLHGVMPDNLKDTKTLRDTKVSTADYEEKGRQFFQSLYGDTAANVQGLLDSIYPDMGWFSNTVAYGAVYGFTEVTDQLETSYALVGTLIAGDTPLQINWHLNNARRGGATLEQARAVRQIAIDTSKSTGVIWKNQVPEVN
ncbi:hypothetical protein OF83DRAFT_610193 [Amylostereum chailletii]|nr:hypothetical protein OF83DRAFT_610193 [Amylostereum chailletii]